MNEPEFLATLGNRIEHVEFRVAAACARAGRARSEVAIIAVTKTLSAGATRLVPQCGLTHLGESRPQDLWKKAADLAGVTWHFMGHLQRNKIDKTLPLVSLFHSVDSVRLLTALDAEAGRLGRAVPVLLEVNASGETTKQGFAPSEVLNLAPMLDGLLHLRVDGLMTMAAPSANPDDCRPTFATLRSLRDQLQKAIDPKHPCRELSMGMTNDFEIAIEEGATLIRLGSIYFEGIEL